MTQNEELLIQIDSLRAQMKAMEDEVRHALLTQTRYASAARRKQCGLTLSQAARLIAEEFGVSVEDIRGPVQSRTITMARNAFYLLAQERTGHSLQSVAIFCRRHISTVASGKQRAQVQQIVNESFGTLFRRCCKRLGGENK